MDKPKKEVLYTRVKPINKRWVQKLAKANDLKMSRVLDALLDKARKEKIELDL